MDKIEYGCRESEFKVDQNLVISLLTKLTKFEKVFVCEILLDGRSIEDISREYCLPTITIKEMLEDAIVKMNGFYKNDIMPPDEIILEEVKFQQVCGLDGVTERVAVR